MSVEGARQMLTYQLHATLLDQQSQDTDTEMRSAATARGDSASPEYRPSSSDDDFTTPPPALQSALRRRPVGISDDSHLRRMLTRAGYDCTADSLDDIFATAKLGPHIRAAACDWTLALLAHPRPGTLLDSMRWPTLMCWGKALLHEHKCHTLQLVVQHNSATLVQNGLAVWLNSVAQEGDPAHRATKLAQPKYRTMLANARLPPRLHDHVRHVLLADQEQTLAIMVLVSAALGRDDAASMGDYHLAITNGVDFVMQSARLVDCAHWAIQHGKVQDFSAAFAAEFRSRDRAAGVAHPGTAPNRS